MIDQERDTLSIEGNILPTDDPLAPTGVKTGRVERLPEIYHQMSKEEADEVLSLWMGRCVFLKSLEER